MKNKDHTLVHPMLIKWKIKNFYFHPSPIEELPSPSLPFLQSKGHVHMDQVSQASSPFTRKITQPRKYSVTFHMKKFPRPAGIKNNSTVSNAKGLTISLPSWENVFIWENISSARGGVPVELKQDLDLPGKCVHI